MERLSGHGGANGHGIEEGHVPRPGQKRGYAKVNNLNFRPANQQPVKLPAGEAPKKVTPKDARSKQMPIEFDPTAPTRSLSLRHFLNFIKRVFGVFERLPDDTAGQFTSQSAAAVIASVETVTGWMGTTPDKLFLNSEQRSDFTTFTLIADHAVRAASARVANKNPPEVARMGVLAGELAPLARLYQHPPLIRIEREWFQHNKNACREGLHPEVFAAVMSKVDANDHWEEGEGRPGFIPVRTFLLNKYWSIIRGSVTVTT